MVDRKAGAGFDQVMVTMAACAPAPRRSTTAAWRTRCATRARCCACSSKPLGISRGRRPIERGAVPEEADGAAAPSRGGPLGEIVRLLREVQQQRTSPRRWSRRWERTAARMPAGWSDGIQAVRAELTLQRNRRGRPQPGGRLGALLREQGPAPGSSSTALLQADRSFRFGPEFVASTADRRHGRHPGEARPRAPPTAGAGEDRESDAGDGALRLCGARPDGQAWRAFLVLVERLPQGRPRTPWEGVDGFVAELVGPEPDRLVQDLRSSSGPAR